MESCSSVISNFLLLILCSYQLSGGKNGLFQKKSKQGGGVEDIHGISRDLEEKTCGNFRGQLKKKCKFQGCSRKTNAKFPWVLVFDFGISRGCHTNLQNFQGQKLFFSGISWSKVTNLKFPGAFQKSISSILPVWVFSGIVQCQNQLYITHLQPCLHLTEPVLLLKLIFQNSPFSLQSLKQLRQVVSS